LPEKVAGFFVSGFFVPSFLVVLSSAPPWPVDDSLGGCGVGEDFVLVGEEVGGGVIVTVRVCVSVAVTETVEVAVAVSVNVGICVDVAPAPGEVVAVAEGRASFSLEQLSSACAATKPPSAISPTTPALLTHLFGFS